MIASDNESAKEESSDEDSTALDASDTFTIGGKTSYAAFMDRLDDVSYNYWVSNKHALKSSKNS